MYFEDFLLKTKIEIAPAVIEKEKMLSFSRQYDNVPLHTDEEYAKSTHFGRLLAPGVMSFLEVWAKYLEADVFGDELIAGKSQKIEWYSPVFADDVLSSEGEITALTRRNEKNGIVELTVSAFNQNGQLVLKGITEAIVKCRIK